LLKILSNVNVSTDTVPGVWALIDEMNKKKTVIEEKAPNIFISQVCKNDLQFKLKNVK